MNKKKILAISGSNRINSVNYHIINTLAKAFEKEALVETYDIFNLPHFDPNIDPDKYPTLAKDFLQKIKEADGVFISTPEYVFSMPSLLKNALEWTVSQNVFSYKPTAFIVAAAGGQKTFESLDLVLKTLLQVEIPNARKLLIQGGRSKITPEGKLQDDTLEDVKKVFKALLN